MKLARAAVAERFLNSEIGAIGVGENLFVGTPVTYVPGSWCGLLVWALGLASLVVWLLFLRDS